MSPLQIGELLTAIMIGCFGVSWPFSLRKAIVSKSTKGQSLLFLLLIDIGYAIGVTGRLISWPSDPTWITYLSVCIYCFNFLIVSVNLIVWFINYSNEKKQKDTN